MGLEVVQTSGTPLTLGASMLRNLLRAVDILPVVGLPVMFFSDGFRRCGDWAAGTWVIYRRESEKLLVRSVIVSKQPMPPSVPLRREEQDALIRFANRRLTLSAARAHELAAPVAPLVASVPRANPVDTLVDVAAWLTGDRGLESSSLTQKIWKGALQDRVTALTALTQALEHGSKDVQDADSYPAQYRELCRDLALARSELGEPRWIEPLNQLALRGQRLLYRPLKSTWMTFAQFWAQDFPRAVRQERVGIFWMSLLFYGAALLLMFGVRRYPELAYTFLPDSQLQSMEAMYDPASEHFLTPRASSDDAGMFGFYIANNIGVAFRTFASGIFFGVGSLFFMVVNSVLLGVAAGHLTNLGFTQTFFPFIVAHGAPELTAIVFSGVAGTKLGYALMAPGKKSRLDALREAATHTVPLLYGCVGMLVIAACLEAFWSSRPMDITVKYSVGAVCWLLLVAYFVLAGRRRAR
jgi:uncharacterized membrane protein SpoIIM required for sporulation